MSDMVENRYMKHPGIKKVRVWGKGQFTIPIEIRERLGIDEGTILEVFQAGKALIVSPEKSRIKELAASVQKDMRQKEINVEELLAELREGSHEYET